MFASSNVANDGPPAPDRVVESTQQVRSGSLHVCISSQHEYHLHDRTPNRGYKLELKQIPYNGKLLRREKLTNLMNQSEFAKV